MGWLGQLFAGRGDVKGRILVQERPPETRYILRVAFFLVDAGAPPPFRGPPPSDILQRAPAGDSKDDPNAMDLGESFTASLAPGHYQILVMSLPFRVERGEVEIDPEGQEIHWPLASAFEVQKDDTRYLSLRITVRAGEPKVERPSTHTFLDRIGPWLSRRYREAVDLATEGRSKEAIAAYDAILASREAGALSPKDREELQIVMVTSQAKCLLDLGRTKEAMEALDGLGQVLRVLAASQDLITRGDFLSTAATAAGRLRRYDAMCEHAVLAVSTGRRAIESGGPAAEWVSGQIDQIWGYCIGVLNEAAEHERLLALVGEGQKAAAMDEGLRKLGMLCTFAKMEALSALGREGDARAVAEKLMAAGRLAGWGRTVLDGMERTAMNAKLERAAAVFSSARK